MHFVYFVCSNFIAVCIYDHNLQQVAIMSTIEPLISSTDFF